MAKNFYKLENTLNMKRYILSLCLATMSFLSISAGALRVDNYVYTYGNGIVRYETDKGEIINTQQMLDGCKVINLIVNESRIIALTDGISDISNDYIFDNMRRIMLSEDSGKSFVDVTPDYFLYDNHGEVRITAIGGSQTEPSRIVACISSNSTLPQYFESTDFCKSWQFFATGDYGYAKFIELLPESNGILTITSGSSMTDEISAYQKGKGWSSYDTEQFSISGLLSNIGAPGNLLYYSPEMVKVSSDGGESWQNSHFGKDLENISKFCSIASIIEGQDSKILYALIIERRSELFPDTPLAYQIAKSDDAGKNWVQIDKGEIKIDYNSTSQSFIKIEDHFYIFDGTNILSVIPVTDNTGIVSMPNNSHEHIQYRDGMIMLPSDCTQYFIYDSDARIVKSGASSPMSISVSDLPEGVYIVMAKTHTDRSVTSKITVSH